MIAYIWRGWMAKRLSHNIVFNLHVAASFIYLLWLINTLIVSSFLVLKYFFLAASCPQLAPPMFGSVNFTQEPNRYGSNAIFSCRHGFGMEGSPSRMCQVDGTWSGLTPSCMSETNINMCIFVCMWMLHNVLY